MTDVANEVLITRIFDAPREAVFKAWTDPDEVSAWYGLKKGLRGRFGMYVPPVLEQLGLAEVEHNARNNRVRAAQS